MLYSLVSGHSVTERFMYFRIALLFISLLETLQVLSVLVIHRGKGFIKLRAKSVRFDKSVESIPKCITGFYHVHVHTRNTVTKQIFVRGNSIHNFTNLQCSMDFCRQITEQQFNHR